MGYLFTTCKDSEKLNIHFDEIIYATDEEVEIAKIFLHSNFDDTFVEMEESLSEEITYCIYKNTLALFLRYVQEWMNTAMVSTLLGKNYRPSAEEEAILIILTRKDLADKVTEYQNGKMPSRDFTIFRMPDEEVFSFREKYSRKDSKPSEDGLIDIGTTAFHVIDYKRAIPVKVTDRKGFLFFCEDADREQHIVRSYELFRTEEEANKLVAERNERRNNAIEKYHLLDSTDDEKLQSDRSLALEWLHFNQDIPELLIKELEKSIEIRAAV